MVFIESVNIELVLFIIKVDLGISKYKNEYESLGYKVYEIFYKIDEWVKDIANLFINKINVLMG